MQGEFEMSMMGGLTFFLGTPNQTNKGRDLHYPKQVHKRATQKIWNGGLQSNWYSHEPIMLKEPDLGFQG